MTPTLNRRSFLGVTAALAATTGFPRLGVAQGAPLTLSATKRTLDIDGRAASVYGLVNGTGGTGLDETVHHCSYEEAFREELRAFWRSIVEGAPVECDADAGRDDVRTLLEAFTRMLPATGQKA